MRALFSSLPLYGHLLPLLPLAVAARSTGVGVCVSTHDDLARVAGPHWFEASGPSLPALAAETARRHGPSSDDLDDVQQIVSMFVTTRVDLALNSLEAVARRHKPDVMIADNVDFIAPVVAAALGIPWVPVSVTTELPGALRGVFETALAHEVDVRTEAGNIDRAALIDVWPSWLQSSSYAAPDDLVPMRPQPFAGPPPATRFLPRESGQPPRPARNGRGHLPTVVLTLGTVVEEMAVVSSAARSLLQLDVNVVVTAGPGQDPRTLDLLADRVQVVDFVPLDLLLNDSDLVVSAGGAGTTLAALARGRPMVLLPQVADQHLVAERVAAFGAAVTCGSVADLHDVVAGALANSSLHTAADQAARRIAAMPGPDRAWEAVRSIVER